MKVSIYVLRDPRDGGFIPRYVGITIKSLKRRLSNHLSKSSLSSNTHKNNWIKSLLEDEVRPTIHLIEEVDGWECACKIEQYWIEKFKKYGYNLTNCTNGGDGMVGVFPSEETRKKIGIKSKNRFCSEETRRKRSVAMIGKIVSETTRKKLSESKKGTILSLETKNKISETNKGRIIPIEVRKKISKSSKGKKMSEGARLKMKMNRIGKKASEKTKLKMSISQKKRATHIFQYDLQDNFLKEWGSVSEISLAFNCSKASIYNACLKQKQSIGFKWKYKENNQF